MLGLLHLKVSHVINSWLEESAVWISGIGNASSCFLPNLGNRMWNYEVSNSEDHNVGCCFSSSFESRRDSLCFELSVKLLQIANLFFDKQFIFSHTKNLYKGSCCKIIFLIYMFLDTFAVLVWLGCTQVYMCSKYHYKIHGFQNNCIRSITELNCPKSDLFLLLFHDCIVIKSG